MSAYFGKGMHGLYKLQIYTHETVNIIMKIMDSFIQLCQRKLPKKKKKALSLVIESCSHLYQSSLCIQQSVFSLS